MKFIVLSAVLFAATVVTATAQSPQNPSPMVEHTRAHERLEPTLPPGTTQSVDVGLPQPATVFVPGDADGRLLIHFMGAEFVPLQAAVRSKKYNVVAVVNLGAGSGAFERPFLDAAAFPALLDSLAGAVGAEFERIDLSAFSAGYGAVRGILRHHPNRIDGVLLLDALHTGYLPDGMPPARGGRLDSTLLEPFLRFAREALSGGKAFVLTHSEVFPGTFASTTETSDYLVDQLGLERRAVLEWGPVGMQQLSEARAGNLRILGFAGNSAPDHVDHLHGMPAFLRLLDNIE